MMDWGVSFIWISFEPRLWIANMTEGPHMLQLTHEGVPPPTLSYSFQVTHPAILPLIWLLTTVVMGMSVVRGSITSMDLENLSFAPATSIEFPSMHMLATTGSIVHMVTHVLAFLHLHSTRILLSTSPTSFENPSEDLNEEMISCVNMSTLGTPLCLKSMDRYSFAIRGGYSDLNAFMWWRTTLSARSFLCLSWWSLEATFCFGTPPVYLPVYVHRLLIVGRSRAWSRS